LNYNEGMTKNIIKKTALITGGAKRIGAHITEFLHSKGMNVLIHYRHSEAEAKKLKLKLNIYLIQARMMPLFKLVLINLQD